MERRGVKRFGVWIYALIPMATLAAFCPTISIATPRTAAACEPVDGLTEALEGRSARFVVLGELHGTTEIPQFFGNVVCQLGNQHPLVVALEFTHEDGDAIQRFVHDRGPRKAFLKKGSWVSETQDGRTSQSMLAMIERLRDMVRTGQSIEIVGIVPSENDDLPQNYYELGLANELRHAASSHPAATVVLLIGNLHAGKNVLTRYHLRPAVSLLPPDDVIALHNDGPGGDAWECKEDSCGVHEVGGLGTPGARRIVSDSKRYEGFDGYFAIGTNYTSSKPASAR